MSREAGVLGEVEPSRTQEHRNPISIAVLFYLLTLAAILAACLRRLSGDEAVTTGSLATAVAAGSLIGVMIGFLGGTFYFKSVKAALVGFAMGAGLGALSGSLTMIGKSHFVSLLATVFAGCWLMLVVMLLAARWQAVSSKQ